MRLFKHTASAPPLGGSQTASGGMQLLRGGVGFSNQLTGRVTPL